MPVEFGPYRVVRSLGKGGFGEVFEVVHGETNVHYALKSITGLPDHEDAERFRREAEAMARLRHPNVARIHSADLSSPRPYLVQELLRGGDLAARIKAGSIPVEEAVSLTIQLAEGLSAVHAEGILHRDLKPENVLLDAAGVPKLVDFGLARLEDRTQLTETHSLMGTPSYMSPEQAQGAGVDARSDVYSLTALLYALLVGRPPFESRGSLLALLDAVMNEVPQRPSAVRPGLPAWLDELVLRGLAKSPSERPQGARELVVALERPKAAPERSRARALVGLSVALALLGLGAWFALEQRVEEQATSPGPSASRRPSPGPRTSPSVVAWPKIRNEVLLKEWSDYPTSGWLFDGRTLIVLDGRGRALGFDLETEAKQELFRLPLLGAKPEKGTKSYFHLAQEEQGWLVGVQSFPVYRHDLTKPAAPLQLQRTLASWRQGLYFSADRYRAELHCVGEVGLTRIPLPHAGGSNTLTVEELIPAPEDWGLLVLTKRRLLLWSPDRPTIDLEAAETQAEFSAMALSADRERVYVGSRSGDVVWAEWSSLRSGAREWARFPAPPAPPGKMNLAAHVGSLAQILSTESGLYSVACYGTRAELIAWEPETHARLGAVTYRERVGVVSLTSGPRGEQLVLGLGSGGVRLVGVGELRAASEAPRKRQ